MDDPPRRHRVRALRAAWWRRDGPALARSRRGSLVPDEDQGFYIAAADPARRRLARRAPTRWSRGGRRRSRTNPMNEYVDRLHRLRLRSAAPSARTRPPSSSPEALGRAPGARCRRARWASSTARPATIKEGLVARLQRRRRSSAWAPPAASSSTCRTAATAARRRLARGVAAVHRRGEQSPKLALGADRSGARTCRSSTSTSTARRPRPRRAASTSVFNTLAGHARLATT